ncbi:phenylacetic acid degradation protein [Novosphingobium endophyticum]|uniref:Phenylacetic acid degradation protein n=1 Tax=Novosphingobium endophyticum TaxID=1955250 RepID=A0A916X4I7_9SPHN|nr:PaaI family thioesterase [Novosphingobium endophyticum]GGC01354.1 phenylacetic acid degradation protein [Novosphingobium endophyticum]
MTDAPDNETRRFIADAVAGGKTGVPLTCNAAFETMGAILVSGTPGDVLVSFEAGEGTAQGNGVVSGGTLAAFLDSAMAVAVLSALKPGQTCSTISLNVNLMRPGFVGTLYVKASVERMGRRVAFAHARLMDGDDKVLATATSSLAVIATA